MSPPRPVDTVTDHLRREILAGRWEANDRLPPERALAETLGVSRLTLRAALAHLAAEGLLHPRQGSGVEVLPWRRTAGVALLPHLLAVDDGTLLGPLLQLRRAVAQEAVATACRTATEAELDDLAARAAALATETDLDRLAEGNLAFAYRVLRLARNLPLELLFNTVAQVLRARPDIQAAMLVDTDIVRASFPAVVGLLRQRDPDAARLGVRRALEALDAATLDRLEAA